MPTNPTRRATVLASAGFAAVIWATLRLPAARAQTATPPTLDARTAHAKAMAGEIVLVDIRTPEEWKQTGLPASAHAVTMDQPPATLVPALAALAGTDKSKPLALICRTGNRSSHLAAQLRKVGFTNVIDVSEGMAGGRNGLGWVKAGLPLRPGSEAGQAPKLDAAAAAPGATQPSCQAKPAADGKPASC